MQWAVWAILGLMALYFGIQGILCAVAVQKATGMLDAYHAKTVQLDYGKMAYVDSGAGEPVLALHGICGGYDQIYNDTLACLPGKRIIAPSRFGYPGSDAPQDPSPREQARALAQLLDALGIHQAYVLGTSAGGTSAIRFALDYPERTKGLILISSAMPLAEKPGQYPEYQGPPPFLCNDYGMWLMSPLFPMTMGIEADMVYGILPVEQRKEGIRIDAALSNPDMARNFDQYSIEELKVKTIIFHAQDDKFVGDGDMKKSLPRFPNCTYVSFETGGHKLEGHSAEVVSALAAFTEESAVQ